MSVTRMVLQRLDHLEQHLTKIERILLIMAKGMDAMAAAVDHNAAATDGLSDEVQIAIDWIKNHPAGDPAMDAQAAELAARLEEKNNKALSAKDQLDAAISAVSASGGPATT